MVRPIKIALLAGAAWQVAIPAVSFAQSGRDAAGEEIIVTARREAENLQDVPVSVQVVSGNEIKKLSIATVNEIAKLSPGLTLAGNASNETVILRGVRWTPGAGTPATPIYLNEISFDPANVLQNLFDVGQVEILRGPQGTSRGAASISGAITFTTRRPDLDDFGGYAQGSYGSADRVNLQGAINIPVVKDVLAFRLAANFERNEYDRVHSINSNVDPRLKGTTLRLSALFKPTDALSVDVMFQRSRQTARYFNQVVGTGSPGFAALGIAANYNGPALTAEDRRSVQDGPAYYPKDTDLLTINASWDILGQRLSYNFGRQFAYNSDRYWSETDPANVLPGFSPRQPVRNLGLPKFSIHEIRLSSRRKPGRFFDYDIGYYRKNSGGTIEIQGQAFLPGAFGAPFISAPGAVTTPVSRYTIDTVTDFGLAQTYESIYGNVQLHIDDKTELSAGIRQIWDKVPITLQTSLSTAFVTFPRFLPAASGGCPSPLLPNSPVYGAGYCDVQATTAGPLPAEAHNDKHKATIYSISLSRKFSDDVMVYATVGSSFRTGLPSIGGQGLPANLVTALPEKATSYELGIKTTPARAVRFNAAIFQIDYKDQLTQFQGVEYLDRFTGQSSRTSLSFYTNVDSRIRGVEAELVFSPVKNLNLSANVAYSKTQALGSLVPCNAATPLTANNPINYCPLPKGTTINSSAPFQAVFNGDYTHSLGAVDGYFRFNINHQGNNPNFSTSTVAAKAYTLVDLFAGISGNDAAWDVGFYAKNVFNKRVLLTSLPISNPYALFAAPLGYETVSSTLPRELGVTVRWSFGSR